MSSMYLKQLEIGLEQSVINGVILKLKGIGKVSQPYYVSVRPYDEEELN